MSWKYFPMETPYPSNTRAFRERDREELEFSVSMLVSTILACYGSIVPVPLEVDPMNRPLEQEARTFETLSMDGGIDLLDGSSLLITQLPRIPKVPGLFRTDAGYHSVEQVFYDYSNNGIELTVIDPAIVVPKRVYHTEGRQRVDLDVLSELHAVFRVYMSQAIATKKENEVLHDTSEFPRIKYEPEFLQIVADTSF